MSPQTQLYHHRDHINATRWQQEAFHQQTQTQTKSVRGGAGPRDVSSLSAHHNRRAKPKQYDDKGGRFFSSSTTEKDSDREPEWRTSAEPGRERRRSRQNCGETERGRLPAAENKRQGELSCAERRMSDSPPAAATLAASGHAPHKHRCSRLRDLMPPLTSSCFCALSLV